MKLAAWIFAFCALAVCSTAARADDADIAAVSAANQAFYAALSARDAKAMEAVWANKPYVTNIGPRSKALAIGFDEAVAKYWPTAFATFSRMVVVPSAPQIETDGKIAWVIGTETVALQPASGGDPLRFETFVTNVFEKDGARWLMISHHAQMVPK